MHSGIWMQNTRHSYWPMLGSGDWEQLQPYFKLFSDQIPLSEARSQLWWGHSGAMFPETGWLWGTYEGGSGFGYGCAAARIGYLAKPGITINTYIRHHRTGTLELVAMMLDYFHMTDDEKFAKEMLVPTAASVVRFFAEHYEMYSGKLQFRSQALETEQECTNPATDVAGVLWMLPQLLDLPSAVLPADDARRQMIAALLAQAPPLPLKPIASVAQSGGCSVEGCACLASHEGCQPRFTTIHDTIGLQTAQFDCTKLSQPKANCYTCTSVATCEEESKAVCGADAGCKGFSLSPKWFSGLQAQYFTNGASNPHDHEPEWTHYRKDDAHDAAQQLTDAAEQYVAPCEYVNVPSAHNVENAALYSVFPFRIIGHSNKTGVNTYLRRPFHNP
jgi:hypothetical protein